MGQLASYYLLWWEGSNFQDWCISHTNWLEQQRQQVIKERDMKPTESSSFIIFILILAKDL